MGRILAFAAVFFAASVLAPIAHGQSETVQVEGFIACANNGSSFACNAGPQIVTPDIVAGSTFKAHYTLPLAEPTGVFPDLFGPDLTTYEIPAGDGEFEVQVDDDILLTTGPIAPAPLAPDSLFVNIGFNTGSFWGVFLLADFSGTVIAGTHFCNVFFNQGNLGSGAYFVLDDLFVAPGGPWNGLFWCRAFNPDTNEIGEPLLIGLVQDLASSVSIDFKPGSDPNCVNPDSSGKSTVAVLGSEGIDVAMIDESTLTFGSASRLGCDLKELKGQLNDGFTDLVCQFETQEVAWPTEGSDCDSVDLRGALFDGTSIVGSDLACLAGEDTCGARGPEK